MSEHDDPQFRSGAGFVTCDKHAFGIDFFGACPYCADEPLCQLVYTGRFGGKPGTRCLRPEREHCPSKQIDCDLDSCRGGKRVHHVFHRSSKREATGQRRRA